MAFRLGLEDAELRLGTALISAEDQATSAPLTSDSAGVTLCFWEGPLTPGAQMFPISLGPAATYSFPQTHTFIYTHCTH
ncbi:hypothetical protein XELAEV_18046280mg [Xenopus laevis]|uniref:Uncharacterized protein n=1 Tax=Xenopus laevis TaxID=8355 RepID=A0A974BSN5_XENLA|nr:hypothetical protein XELAEV_18046280mg [Xenopus laevis]